MIVETTVLRHVAAYFYRDRPEIAYWRDARTDQEIDFIVSSPRYTLPIEVKYRQNSRPSARDAFSRFCLAESPPVAYWISQKDDDFEVSRFEGGPTRVLEIPAHVFTYLLGQAERQLWLDEGESP